MKPPSIRSGVAATAKPRTRGARVRMLFQRVIQREGRAGQQLGVLVQQQGITPACRTKQPRIVLTFAAPLLKRDDVVDRGVPSGHADRPVV